MYFSRISLREDATSSSEFWNMFRDPYFLHQSIWSLFGDRSDRERDFLYHLAENGGRPVVYAVSGRRPPEGHPLWRAEPKEYRPQVSVGMRLGFLLRVNPVRTREGKRHDVVMEAKHCLKALDVPRRDWPPQATIVQETVEEWFRAREEKAGFRAIAVRADGYRQLRMFKAKGQLPVRVSTVDLTGIMEVTDASLLVETLFRGLGPAKAFGCGLLLVRRI